MAYIKFNKIDIQGFMSIKDSSVVLEDRGLVFVKGINEFEPKSQSNGSGKSAIFESIIWALTGYTSRNSSSVVNRFSDTGAKVHLSFYVDTVEYSVTRTEKHYELGTSLKIIKNGEDISGNTTTKSKAILKEELPQLNYDMLTSIIVLSQGLPGRLSSLKPSARKSRLEELSSMESYLQELDAKTTETNRVLSAKRVECVTELTRIETTINNNKGSIIRSQAKIQEIEEKAGKIISKEVYESYLKESEELATVSSNNFNIITDLNMTLSKLRMEYQDIANKVSNAKSNILRLNNEKSSSSASGICPTCNRPITSIEVVEQFRQNLDNQINGEMEIVKLEAPKLLDLQSKINEYESKINEVNEATRVANSRLSEIRVPISMYESFSSSTDYLHETIKDCTEANAKLLTDKVTKETELTEIAKDLELLSYVKKSMSRKLRSFLLKGTVDYINSKAKIYSSMMFQEQGMVSIEINGNNLDIKLGDQSFEELSGGEARRVDLILQLCQRDLAKNESGFSSNILVLDEVLDYLDSQGVEDAINLIESKSSDTESILVVSHKSDISLPYDSVMQVVKRSDRLSYILD